ncbi:MAG: hypothetical protein LWW86_05310 [Micrococcales bacterium]|nr:hypothetical protein [Micrococcales bacterium]
MPQVSADAFVPWPPAAAEGVCRGRGPVRVPLWLRPAVRPWHMARDGWTVTPEGDGARIIRRFGYTIRYTWLHKVAKPALQAVPVVRADLDRALRAGRRRQLTP